MVRRGEIPTGLETKHIEGGSRISAVLAGVQAPRFEARATPGFRGFAHIVTGNIETTTRRTMIRFTKYLGIVPTNAKNREVSHSALKPYIHGLDQSLSLPCIVLPISPRLHASTIIDTEEYR